MCPQSNTSTGDQILFSDALKGLRKRLLDLSRRNTLLNFRSSTARSVVIDYNNPNHLFTHLVVSNREMLLLPANNDPDLETDGVVQQPLPQGDASYLQTVLEPNVLERRCKRIASDAKSALEETGSNLLYLAIGFLEWAENTDATIRNRAPLILVPISIRKQALDHTTGCYRYGVSYTEEGIDTNLSLAHKLKEDFALELPVFRYLGDDQDDQNGLTPTGYFNQVEGRIGNMPGWSVSQKIEIGFFSFAKILMYKDLDLQVWHEKGINLLNNLVLPRILVGIDQPDVNVNPHDFGNSYPIDDIPDATPILLDADNSQHSAIIDVINKQKHLVIEGPPGTGKSQTIANIIAAALREKKTVLFLSEKKAALDVVKSRLDKIGMGVFCLELHNYKTNKAETYAQIRRRVELSVPAPADLESKTAHLSNIINHLKGYAEEIGSSIGNTKKTTFEILTSANRWRKHCGAGFVPQEITSTAPLEVRPETIIAHESYLKDLSVTAEQVPAITRRQIIDFLEQHGVNLTSMVPGDEVWFVNLLQQVNQNLKSVADFIAGYGCSDSVVKKFGKDISSVLDVNVDELKAGMQCELPQLFRKLFFQKNRDLCNEFINVRSAFIDHEEKLSSCLNLDLLAEHKTQDICDAITAIDKHFLNKSLSEIHGFSAQMEEVLLCLNALSNLHTPCLPDFNETFAGIKEALSVKRELEGRPALAYVGRLDSLVEDGAEQLINVFEAKVVQRRKFLEEMESLFNLDLVPSPEELKTIAVGLKTGQSGFFASFKKEVRQARASLQKFTRKKLEVNDATIEAVIKLAKRPLYDEAVQEAERAAAPYLGILYQIADGDFSSISPVVSWCSRFTALLGSSARARQILCSLSNHSEQIERDLAPLDEIMNKIQNFRSNHYFHSFGTDKKIAEFFDDLNKLRYALKRFFDSCEGVITDYSLTLEDVFSHVDIYRDKLATMADARYAQLFTDEGFDPWSSSPETISEAIEIFERSNVSFLEHSTTFSSILTDKGIDATVDFLFCLIKILALIVQVVKKFSDRLSSRQKQGSLLYYDSFFQYLASSDDSSVAPIQALIEQIGDVCSSSQYLQMTLSYLRLRNQSHAVKFFPELNYILESIESGVFTAQKALEHYYANLRTAQSNEIFRTRPAIFNFDRPPHENRVVEFIDSDKELLELMRSDFIHKASQRQILSGRGFGLVGDYTEAHLIRHQIRLQQSHLPIRQLVHRAGQALQGYKPCFMMSPLSVAHFLPPGYLHFDLVIMDEASQLRPEDALGGIMRSKQVVVVGDPKQLPPSSFFDRLTGNAADGDGYAINQSESILDGCLNVFERRRLNWHYRSAHESLIAFSNKHFYDDKLLVFPSKHHKSDGYGLRHHHIQDAIYKQGGCNIKEAEAIVSAVCNHLKQYPHQSLGVATFNKAQADQIEDHLDKICRQHPSIARLLVARDATSEPFFIKNLENVQGDERDIIFISTTYGKNEDGVVAQRFGPITHEDGWRRLNVIITRAKMRLEVFTSMRSTDIIVTDTTKKGVSALRDFLKYIETGILQESGRVTGREPDSDFEIDVKDELSRHGYDVECQVGVAGFYIDLAIYNPRRQGEFLLGIECDGATYHSAKSTRDRDRLRQEILENKGWKIHRIWSTDWFVNREIEVKRLLDKITKLISEYPDVEPEIELEAESDVEWKGESDFDTSLHVKQAPQIAVPSPHFDNKDAELRHELEQYRIQNIDVRYGQDDRCILSPQMIDLFVRHKPYDRDMFYRVVPQSIRSNLIGTQLKSFLDDILDIVDEYAI